MIKENDILVLKKNLIKAKNLGYKYIIITYEGSGDSGSIEEVSMTNVIPDNIWSLTEYETIEGADRTVIADWAYEEPLMAVSDWYNNDGGYGIIVINVNDGTYSIENNVRYTNTTLETHSGKI